uniref:Uncharacterized protein n=1 Tax=Caenorhabditis japonica TaxID=281687 RepID=A0A8R1EVU3_CAEJA
MTHSFALPFDSQVSSRDQMTLALDLCNWFMQLVYRIGFHFCTVLEKPRLVRSASGRMSWTLDVVFTMFLVGFLTNCEIKNS